MRCSCKHLISNTQEGLIIHFLQRKAPMTEVSLGAPLKVICTNSAWIVIGTVRPFWQATQYEYARRGSMKPVHVGVCLILLIFLKKVDLCNYSLTLRTFRSVCLFLVKTQMYVDKATKALSGVRFQSSRVKWIWMWAIYLWYMTDTLQISHLSMSLNKPNASTSIIIKSYITTNRSKILVNLY